MTDFQVFTNDFSIPVSVVWNPVLGCVDVPSDDSKNQSSRPCALQVQGTTIFTIWSRKADYSNIHVTPTNIYRPQPLVYIVSHQENRQLSWLTNSSAPYPWGVRLPRKWWLCVLVSKARASHLAKYDKYTNMPNILGHDANTHLPHDLQTIVRIQRKYLILWLWHIMQHPAIKYAYTILLQYASKEMRFYSKARRWAKVWTHARWA